MSRQPTVTDARVRAFTAVSNFFIDRMMPETSGEFVKIYLYLLRHASDGDVSLAPSAVADVFQCTEKDVLRAYRHWETKGLLALGFDEKGELSELRILDVPEFPEESRSFGEQVSSDASMQGVKRSSGTDQMPGESRAVAEDGASAGDRASKSEKTEEKTQRNGQADKEQSARDVRILQDISISGERRQVLMSGSDPAVRQVLFIAEQYLKRPLSRRDTDTLLYFYDELHFPVELIDELIQYCVENHKYSIHYIEKVGLEWYNDGIRTADDAKKRAAYWNKDYFVILKAFGIHDRVPVSREVAYMKQWLYTYGFSIDLIREACERTVTKTGKPNFSYAEGILSSWKKSSVHSMEDVKRLDEEHSKKNRETYPVAGTGKASGKPESPKAGASSGNRRSNRFNNFAQRKYDYSDLEKQLLKRQLSRGEETAADGNRKEPD